MSTKRVIRNPSEGDKKKITRSKKPKDLHVNESEEINNEMCAHDREITQAKKTLKHPVSDDMLDDLEAQVDKFNETKLLEEKIRIHSILKESVKILEQEIDDMVEIIDKIDIHAVSQELKNSTDDIDITDDIVNLEKIVEGMKEEDVMQIKMMHIQKITDIVKRCKSKCDSSKMRIAKCN